MRASFRVDSDNVRARIGKSLQPIVDRGNHQMDIKGLCRVRTQRLHDVRPDGNIGHIMPVHHVDMDPVAARFINCADFLAQPREIGGEDRRRDQWVGHGHSAR